MNMISEEGGLFMFYFSLEPTPLAQWQSLVLDALTISDYEFDEDLENYLVLTLDRFTQEQSLASSVIATDYMSALNDGAEHALRHVGDQCLLLSGMFPERALKKHVSLDYFINIGRQSYLNIANDNKHTDLNRDLFYNLSFHFIGLMDVLNTIRQLPRLC